MNKPRYQVLALDLDGTLTNSKKEVTPVTRAALKRAALAGVKIVLASGRPVMGIWPLARDLEMDRLDGYILAGNGSQVFSCKTGETIYTSAIPHECIAHIERIATQFDVAALCYDDKGVITSRPDDHYVGIEAYNNALPISYVPSLSDAITWAVPKMMVVGQPENLQKCCACAQQFFRDQISVFMSEAYFMECTSLGNSKASGLERLLNHLGLEKDTLMACGDAFNDLPMLEYAGLSVAMGNSYPEVLKACHVVTATNDEDGVARAIYKYIFDEPVPF